MRISFNDLFIAKILMPDQARACKYITERFLLYSLPLIFKNKVFKNLFIEESLNFFTKDDAEISTKLINNLEIILENNIDELIFIFESISIDKLKENYEFEINELHKEFSTLLSSKYSVIAEFFTTVKFGSIILPKKELALEVREKIINEEICFSEAIEKYSIGVEGQSKGIIGPTMFNNLPNWLISVLRKTNLNFPSEIWSLDIGFMMVQTFEINYPDLSSEEELNYIFKFLVENIIDEISKRIEFGVISTKMKVKIS